MERESKTINVRRRLTEMEEVEGEKKREEENQHLIQRQKHILNMPMIIL